MAAVELHFINTGKAFPYAYYLSVLSALKTQKADINMWLFDEPQGAYWNLIKPKVEVRRAEFPDFRALKGKDENFRMAHMVDWCRWKVLYNHGGMFMDMDTLALKDMSEYVGNGREVTAPLRVKDMDATAFPLNNSFVACRAKSPIIGSILRFVEGKMNEPDMTWGDTGPLIFNTVIREHLDDVRILPQYYCEPYRGGELLYDVKIPDETRMIHVCGASNAAFGQINEQWIETANVAYAKLARSLFTPDELHPFREFDAYLKAKGDHYRPMFDYLMNHPVNTIVEIGTYNGDNAEWMIRLSGAKAYWGYDLFESMDEETRQAEMSHPDSPTLADVQAKLEQTGAEIHLHRGNTRDGIALPQSPDVVFIDGGHSLETIESDWSKVKAVMGDNTAVFFDDYFPDRTDKGCKPLIDAIKGKVFPKADSYASGVKSQLAMVISKWVEAQTSEASFWNVSANMAYGAVKQEGYVDMLGFSEFGRGYHYDLKGKTVLDVGGGPASLLLRCHNVKGTVVDPCEFQPWVYERYKAAGIRVVRESAEDWEPDQFYDEVWCYNVLQHVKNPEKVVGMMMKAGRRIRVFEWIDTPIDTGHPHSFTTEKLNALFGKGTGRNVAETDFLHRFLHVPTEARCWYGVFDHTPSRPKHYRFHYPGLVHLPISEAYMGCAFTQKIVKLSKMLLSLGHEVYLYGCEGSDAPCTEFVQTHTLQDIRDAWGDPGNDEGLGYDWRKWNFRHDFNADRKPVTLKHYANTIAAINARKRPDDFLLLPQGHYHKPISDAVNLWLTCEPGVGYHGVFARFKAFESAALQNFSYGSSAPGKCINGNYYDRVIPNYFDPKDFPLCEDKGGYYLFIGRMIQRKGVWTAIEATRAIGAKLILAGQETDEVNVKNLPPHCEFVGYVDTKQRAELMGHAKAVFVPTLYLESFGGVNVEAQLCGTPAITTNFGCFPETVRHGVTGYCCNTLQDFVEAARKAPDLDPFTIHAHALRYAMDNVRHEYQRWFDDLYQLYRSARFSEKGWSHL